MALIDSQPPIQSLNGFPLNGFPRTDHLSPVTSGFEGPSANPVGLFGGVLEGSTYIDKILPALFRAKKNIGRIVKDSTNPHYKSTYTKLEDLLAAVEPPLEDEGLFVMQPPTGDGDSATVETVIFHADSGQYFRSRLSMKPAKNDPQGIGGAITYARRYTILAMLGLKAEDDDGNGASGKGAQPAATILRKTYAAGAKRATKATIHAEWLRQGRNEKDLRAFCLDALKGHPDDIKVNLDGSLDLTDSQAQMVYNQLVGSTKKVKS